MKIIAIDFDETIAQTMKEIARLLDEPFNYNDFSNYKFPFERWGHDLFYEKLYDAHYSNKLEAIPDAIQTIKELQKEYKIYILTSNKDHHAKGIKAWLKTQGLKLEVKCVKSFDDKFNEQWDILIDDHPVLIRKVSLELSTGLLDNRRVYQLSQPYNQSLLHWNDIKERLLIKPISQEEIIKYAF